MMSRISLRKACSPASSLADGTSFERDGSERFGELSDGVVPIFCRQQIELAVTVVTPMGNSHSVVLLEMLKRGPKQCFLSQKFCRGAKFWESAFVADDDEPKGNGPRVVVCPGIKGSNANFVPVIEQTEVFFLEIPDGQAALAILTDDIDQHQRRLHANCGRLCGARGLLQCHGS